MFTLRKEMVMTEISGHPIALVLLFISVTRCVITSNCVYLVDCFSDINQKTQVYVCINMKKVKH